MKVGVGARAALVGIVARRTRRGRGLLARAVALTLAGHDRRPAGTRRERRFSRPTLRGR